MVRQNAVYQTPQDVIDLKEATKAAHEVLKDIRKAINEAESKREEIARMIREIFDEKIESQVASSLAEYRESIDKAIEDSTNAVFKRFDDITRTLMGETKQDKRAGRKPLDAMVEEYFERNPLL